MKALFKSFILLLCFIPSFLFASTSATIDEKAGVRVESWDYAKPALNEEAQLLPIPTRIHEIIYPTVGFPSLVFENDPFSIVLQLSPSQLTPLRSASPRALRFVVRLSPYFGRTVSRPIPDGFQDRYATPFDFEEHQATGKESFIPFIRFQPPSRMPFEIVAQWHDLEFDNDKLIIRARIPKNLPPYMHRAMDLEVMIFKDDQLIVHDIARHSLGVLAKRERYRFIHMADPQVNNIDIALRGLEFPHHPDLSTQEFAFYQAVKEMNFLNPDFALVSGDLVEGGNTYYNMGKISAFFAGRDMIVEPYENNVEYQLEKSSYWNEYQSIIQFLRRLEFPVFSAIGNHDGYAAYEKQNLSTTLPQIKLTDTSVGPDSERVMFDGKHYWRKMMGPRYYSFDFGAWHFVFLDTYDHRRYFRLSYSNFGANDAGWISEEQMAWLETDLKAAERAGKKIILVGHHDPRGGAQGMFYDREKYRYSRRGILRLGDELWFKYKHMIDDPLYPAQDWNSSQVSVEHGALIDLNYDSAQKLLELIAKYPVTHFFLGHIHANYKDEVELGGKKVEFIHTTALTAQAYQARDIKDYKRGRGEGPGESAHWGYRVFDIAADGTFLEEVYPVELGHLRINIGYDGSFRRKHGGLFSSNRPMPSWLPFSSFLERLDKERLLPWLFAHNDPILGFKALLHPTLQATIAKMREEVVWDETLKQEFSNLYGGLFTKVIDQVGPSQKPQQLFLHNRHPFQVSGIVEFWPNLIVPEMITARVLQEGQEFVLDEIDQFRVATETISMPGGQTPGGRWTRIPVTLPATTDHPLYIDASLVE